MRTVITYGTFDLFHDGHRRLLQRAKELGDYLIVGVTTDTYDRSRGKLNVTQSVLERIENVRSSGLADRIIVEEFDGQKILDVEKWGVDVFAIGSDWQGKFEYLKPYCEVVYLERTRGVSSTQLRNEKSGILHMGLAGAGTRARHVVEEARYVSGMNVEAVWSPDPVDSRSLADQMELAAVAESFDDLLARVDAVHISTPPATREVMIQQAIEAGVHVLCEPPMAMGRKATENLLEAASRRGVVLVDGVRTAYSPGFQRMVAYARTGAIGTIRSVDVTSTSLAHTGPKRLAEDGGALIELATYPLVAVVKLLGQDYQDLRCQVLRTESSPVDLFARIELTYARAIASVTVGIGATSENDLRVAGSTGHLYAPAPWWIADHFETRFDDPRENQRFFHRFEGDGQRYELAELASRVRGSAKRSYKLQRSEIVTVAGIIERARTEAVAFG